MHLVFIFLMLTQGPPTTHHCTAHVALKPYHEVIMAQVNTSSVPVNSVVHATLPKMTIINLSIGRRVQSLQSEFTSYTHIRIVLTGLRHIIRIGK